MSAVLVVLPEVPTGAFGWCAVFWHCTVKSQTCLVSEMSIIHHATGTDSKSVWLRFSHFQSGCCQSDALVSWLPSAASVSLRFSSCFSLCLCLAVICLVCYLCLAFIAALTLLCMAYLHRHVMTRTSYVAIIFCTRPNNLVQLASIPNTHTHTHTQPRCRKSVNWWL